MAEDHELITQDIAVDSMLSVGMPTVCYPKKSLGDRFHKAFLRGWQPNAYIIMEVLNPDEHNLGVEPGDISQFKFRRDGDSWTFVAEVQDSWDVAGDTHVRYSWPERIDKVLVRKYERIEAVLPCNVVMEEGAWVKGQIRDLGAGGCRLILKSPPEEGTNLFLSFTLPDGTTIEDVQSVVRSVVRVGQSAALGCQFAGQEDEAAREVELYVAAHLEQERASGRNMRRVLLIEHNPRIAGHMQRALENRGFDVAIASELVDGFSLIKNLSPTAVMVNIEQDQLPGTEVCRIIRSAPGFRKLPVFIYGRDNDALKKSAIDAGASGYLPYIATPSKITAPSHEDNEA